MPPSRWRASTGPGSRSRAASNHFGPVAPYNYLAAQEGFASIAAATATTTIAPTGGAEARLGQQPHRVSACRIREATRSSSTWQVSVVARAKIRDALKQGRAIPDTWATDREGRPTTDPKAALDGFLQPIGGYKGYGLALIVDLFAGVLSGAAYLTRVESWSDHPEKPQDLGHFFIVIDTRVLGAGDWLAQRVEDFAAILRSTPRSDPDVAVRLPGRSSSSEWRSSVAMASPSTRRCSTSSACWRPHDRVSAGAAARRVSRGVFRAHRRILPHLDREPRLLDPHARDLFGVGEGAQAPVPVFAHAHRRRCVRIPRQPGRDPQGKGDRLRLRRRALCPQFRRAALHPGLLAGAIFVAPWLLVRSIAFNAHNSRFRGLRFRFHGRYGEAFKIFILYGLVTLVTLGLGYFYLKTRLTEFIVRRHEYGATAFEVASLHRAFARAYGRFLLLGIVGFAAVGVLAASLFVSVAGGPMPRRRSRGP
jgi:hypothetical protein